MKSRSIALGASVIALILAGAGQAEAGALGEIGQQLPDTGVAAKVTANVQVPVAGPTRGSLEVHAGGSERPGTTVEAKRRAGDDQSHVVLDQNNRPGVTAYADQRRKGRFELEGQGQASPRHAESTVTAISRHGGKASAHGSVRAPKTKHAGTERSIREHSRRAAPNASLDLGGHEKPLTRLVGIGRAVANPTQLIHAGWLIVLTAAGCLGVSRLVRRLQRTL